MQVNSNYYSRYSKTKQKVFLLTLVFKLRFYAYRLKITQKEKFHKNQ